MKITHGSSDCGMLPACLTFPKVGALER
jgi:hypothetical protein